MLNGLFQPERDGLASGTRKIPAARKLFAAESLERRVLLSAPVITSVNPDPVDLYSAAVAQDFHFVINGSNLKVAPSRGGARVTLTAPNGTVEQELAYVDTTDSTATQIILNTPDFNFVPAGGGTIPDPGRWTVQVINTNAAESAPFGFDVTSYAAPPVITSVTPDPLVIPTSGNVSFTIQGSNFQYDAASLAFGNDAIGISLTPNGTNEGNTALARDSVNLANSSDTVLYITTSDYDDLTRGQSTIAVDNPSNYNSNFFPITTETPLVPTITSQPQSQTVTVGSNVTLFTNASSNIQTYFQWEFDGVAIPNATLSTLTLNNVSTSQSGAYQVVVSDTAGGVSSNPANLVVTANPVITTQPKSQTLQAGGDVTFSVAANSESALSYQWQFKGADLPGDTSATLMLTNVQTAQAGAYDVVVSNSAGSTTSNTATLTVTPAPLPPTITTQPQSQTVTTGATVAFTVSASSTIPLQYQWQFNGADLSGDTNSTLTLTNVQAAQTGAYTVVVSNSSGSVTSDPATLTVSAAPQPPNIFAQPMSQTVSTGNNVTFSVSASSSTALSYQWQFNGANLSGDTDSTLTLLNVAAAQGGAYTVVVTNSIGSVTSVPAALAVLQPGMLPTITTQPASQSVATGGDVTFSVSASGAATLSYQWQLNGSDLAGATDSTLALSNVTAAQAGAYTVVVSNSVGSATSTAATLTVNPTVSTPSGPLSFVLASPAAAVKAGKRGKSVFTVTNTSGQTIKQTLSISLLLSSDNTLAGEIAGLLNTGKKINLKAGRSKALALSFKVPAVTAGNYQLLAQIAGGAPIVAPSPVAVLAAPVKK